MATRRSLSAALSEAAAATHYRDVPAAVRERLVFLVSDVLATIVSGSRHPDVLRAREAFALAGGPATVVGAQNGADAALAALLNGMAVAAEQLQDGHRGARGHPAAHVVPAVLAVAESSDAGGEATLSAMLAGYEAGVRVGLGMQGTPPGVHDIATWGTIAASVGVAHLLSQAAPEPIRRAMELAASMPVLPDAHTVFGGCSGQYIFLGVGAQLGVVFGTSATGGLSAPAGTLERHFGRWAGRSFEDARAGGGVTGARQWSHYELLAGYVKRHPTCAHLHGVNDALEQLLQRWNGTVDDIESVVVETYLEASHFDDSAPHNDRAARFSIPFTVASSLVNRRFDVRSFSPDALRDPRIRALSRRIEIRHRPELDAGYPEGRPAVVTVHLRQGGSCRAEVGRPRGDGPCALDDPDVLAKPSRLLESIVPPDRTCELLTAVQGLANDGVGPLTKALRNLFGENGLARLLRDPW